jgi:hypothetical protein
MWVMSEQAKILGFASSNHEFVWVIDIPTLGRNFE